LHDKELNDAQIGGLGFYLMQALMDDVQILNETGKGTEVVLVKRLTRSEERV
jgi:serine/threonine-protein kinase RsbW